MRLWKAEKQSNGYYLLKNKYRKDAVKGECLRTFNGNNKVEFGDCTAKGGPLDYTSMRLWSIVENGNYALLNNKFKQDAQTQSCIRTFNTDNSISIGDCTGKGGATDYTSMRLWTSDAFPFAKPWGPTGIVGIPYTLPNVPQSGFDQISFPIKVQTSPQAAGFYYAMQYQFMNGNSAYIGLQPTGKDTGSAVFSAFGSGVTPIDTNCTGSADGGAGSSCSKTINLIFGHTYNVTVKRDATNQKIWRGYVKDTVTGDTNEIGAWQPKDGSKGLLASNLGFVEYYPQINACSKIPSTQVFFGPPTANSTVSGTLATPYTYGKCKTLVEFNTQKSGTGWNISVKGKSNQ
ncbi:hypothetical protein COMNV_00847 [Commensalibacter sp. Nvir]|uniref:hypothetical protein n=1 Tax=Commensalibacter sp. Nvir TaxID=3069817 RepID=UPI002D526224|nr:hypothetical protein COMNV_00847 [Commensalibacter sp. Nvir]